jgi:hypothetical protein
MRANEYAPSLGNSRRGGGAVGNASFYGFYPFTEFPESACKSYKSQLDRFVTAITSASGTAPPTNGSTAVCVADKAMGEENNDEGVVLACYNCDLHSHLALCFCCKCPVGETKIPGRDCSRERPHCSGK